MIKKAVGFAGTVYTTPSYEKLKTTLLIETKESLLCDLRDVRNGWAGFDCTLACDG